MLEIRPCATAADEDRSLEIWKTVWPWVPMTLAESQAWKQAQTQCLDVLAWSDGAAVGSAAAGASARRPRVAALHLTVLCGARRQGVGTALYRAVSDWAQEAGVEALDAYTPENDAGGLEFGAHRGFVEVERNSRLALELADVASPEIDPPPGIKITTWAERPELARGIYEVAREGYADVPGRGPGEPDPFEKWLRLERAHPAHRPDGTFVALADGDVVGYTQLGVSPAAPHIGVNEMTAVRRGWRGRGVASALKRAQVAWAKRAGLELLQTQNETRNEPMRRVNMRLGYREGPGQVIMRGPLAR